MDIKGGGINETEAQGLTTRLRAELFNTGKFEVLERELMADILQEQGFQQTGMCDDESCLVEVGQLVGVKYMVGGSVIKIGELYSVSARIVDVETGQILRSATAEVKGNIEEILQNTIQHVSRTLAGLEAERRTNKPAVITLISGLTAVAAGVPFTIMAKSDYETYKQEEFSTELTAEYRNSSKTKYITSYGLYGVGAAAIGTSILLFLNNNTTLSVENSMTFMPTENGVQLCIRF